MTTVIFVHGTGTRELNYNRALAQIEAELTTRRPTLRVEPCLWGDPLGYRFNAGGISLPGYGPNTPGGTLSGFPSEPRISGDDLDVVIWGMLYEDALCELGLLAAQRTTERSTGVLAPTVLELADRVVALRQDTLPAALSDDLILAGIAGSFDTAVAAVIADRRYADALTQVPKVSLDILRYIVARAIVAAALQYSSTAEEITPLFTHAALRDRIVQQLVDVLGRTPGTLSGPGSLAWMATNTIFWPVGALAGRWRGTLTKWALSFFGDILRYQGQGKAICALIQSKVEAASPPVVLLAHSLGGVACVDLLLTKDLLSKVRLLITVGSQAPLFYEIGALQTLPYIDTASLPAFFPPWLNIYDPRDFLSFAGARLFTGRVRDLPLNTGQPFPHAHMAYWYVPALYDYVVSAIDNPLSLLD